MKKLITKLKVKNSLESKNKLKKILPVILLLFLITLVIGITYAIYNITLSGNYNSISTGVISMSYTESTNVISIDNALPMSDVDGKISENYFDFSVTSNLSLGENDPTTKVNYSIEIEPLIETFKQTFSYNENATEEEINECATALVKYVIGVSDDDEIYEDVYNTYKPLCSGGEVEEGFTIQTMVDSANSGEDDYLKILYILEPSGVVNMTHEWTVKKNATEEEIKSCTLWFLDAAEVKEEDEDYEEGYTVYSKLCSGKNVEEFNGLTLQYLLDMTSQNNLDFVSLAQTGIIEYVDLENLDKGYYPLKDDNIKIYLEDITNNEILIDSELISSLSNYELYNTNHTHTSEISSITTKYRLRAWIDYNTDASNWNEDNRYEYKFRVNVNGDAEVDSTLLTYKISKQLKTNVIDYTYTNDEKNSAYYTYIGNPQNDKGITNKCINAFVESFMQLDTETATTLCSGGTLNGISLDSLYSDPEYATEDYELEKAIIAYILQDTGMVIMNYSNDDDNGVFLYDGTDDNNGDYPIYYYRGNVTNNNVLFANMCWKIVRTTSTGGTKLIYNGEPFEEYQNYEKLNESDYKIITNSPTDYLFTFNEDSKEWVSGIAAIDSTTNTIEFNVLEEGDYVLSYTVDSESDNDYGTFYKNDITLASNISGKDQKYTINLYGLTTTDTIKVTYIKNSSNSANSDSVRFSLQKGSGNKKTSCNNTSIDTQLDENSKFNSGLTSPAYLGYMYGEIYTVTYKDEVGLYQAGYVYGNDVTYSDGTYTLTGKTLTSSGGWKSDKSTIADGYHYTCFSSSDTCSKVYYIISFGSYPYYLTFTGGDTLDSAKEKMFTNTNDSTIKTAIDSWYSTNLTSYTDYLENTIFCNDRSYAEEFEVDDETYNGGAMYSKDINATSGSYHTPLSNVLTGTPSLQCTNIRDRFSLSTTNGGTSGYGNNKLTYPIGLLTADEVNLAGGTGDNYNSYYYLFTGTPYWLLSPTSSGWFSVSSGIGPAGIIGAGYPTASGGVRPVISLKQGTTILKGTGTFSDPYIVE